MNGDRTVTLQMTPHAGGTVPKKGKKLKSQSIMVGNGKRNQRVFMEHSGDKWSTRKEWKWVMPLLLMWPTHPS